MNTKDLAAKYRESTLTVDKILALTEEEWNQIELEEPDLAFDLNVELGMIWAAQSRGREEGIKGQWGDFLENMMSHWNTRHNQNVASIQFNISLIEVHLESLNRRIAAHRAEEKRTANLMNEREVKVS